MWFGRRGAGVKLAIGSASDGGKRAVLREEHEVSRKAIAQGRPECSRCPVCSCALLFAQIARETAGAASTRSSLRPLTKRAGSSQANLGRNAPREGKTISAVIVREGGRSSIPEAVVIEPRSRGVLDPRLRGDDSGVRRYIHAIASAAKHLPPSRDVDCAAPTTRLDSGLNRYKI